MLADGTALSAEEQRKHIDCDYGSLSKNPLPAIIHLAVGMSVILRQRNISPELKISNGSTGVLFCVFTSRYGDYTCADGAIVYFPASPLRLHGLPVGCVYIPAVQSSYSIVTDKKKQSYHRKQLPIEPAYAVTGHFAQGKTLPIVVGSLKQRDAAAAYVIASRATSRDGLFLTEEVTLRDLNRPWPRALRMEMARLTALEHNTSVKEGFIDGCPIKVPDEEEEDAKNPLRAKLRWEFDSDRKRKRADSQSGRIHKQVAITQGDNHLERGSTKTHMIQPRMSAPASLTYHYPFPFLIWHAASYSCAYDSLLTPLYVAWFYATELWKAAFSIHSPSLVFVSAGFFQISSVHSEAQAILTRTRERLRNELSSQDIATFPRFGALCTPMESVLRVMGFLSEPLFQVEHTCLDITLDITFSLRTLFIEPNITCFGSYLPSVVTVQQWTDAQIAEWCQTPCTTCCLPTTNQPYQLSDVPLLLTFETPVDPRINSKLLPSLVLTISDLTSQPPSTYRLFGIIYHGSAHYTARIFTPANSQSPVSDVWNYDGMRGSPIRDDDSPLHLESLMTLDGRGASYYLYALCL
ncbi:11854_t:CDS:1 [Acaulospora colombiana]|uniref:11854_t:CDS:1 n=2 Tax=Acaulospora colombiana TaxID=27376 RepID=A0ACA9M5A4_9GLOM|nr:11853_t:CDS:1 [Acaulospora colombiana]CAG8564651.1 11854_t:CDS:1 [Acaulospora colombiana]